VDELNETLQNRLPGDYFEALSIDKPLNPSRVTDLDVHNADTNLEFFHSKTPGNMPPHRLRVKRGAIVNLCANLDIEAGLVNGTRMQLLDMRLSTDSTRGATLPVAKCKVLNGKSKNKEKILVPTRFQHGVEKNSMATPFERLQLPFKPAYAMTVDKAQGKYSLFA
jgi:hypothetical protein